MIISIIVLAIVLVFIARAIVIQNAEKKFGETITFLEFAKIGVLLTAVNVVVYWLFLSAHL